MNTLLYLIELEKETGARGRSLWGRCLTERLPRRKCFDLNWAALETKYPTSLEVAVNSS